MFRITIYLTQLMLVLDGNDVTELSLNVSIARKILSEGNLNAGDQKRLCLFSLSFNV